MAWTRAVMTNLGLKINEAKTSLKDARRTELRLPRLHHRPPPSSKWGMTNSRRDPSKKSILRVKTKVSELLRPNNKGAWPIVRDKLKPASYRMVGVLSAAAPWLQPMKPLIGTSTIMRCASCADDTRRKDAIALIPAGPCPRRIRSAASSAWAPSIADDCFAMNFGRESRMREIRTSGLMSGEGKRSAFQRVTAPFVDSTDQRPQAPGLGRHGRKRAGDRAASREHAGSRRRRAAAARLPRSLSSYRARVPNGAYGPERVQTATGIVVEIVRKIADKVGFVVLPRGRVIERLLLGSIEIGGRPRTSRRRSTRPEPSSTRPPLCCSCGASLGEPNFETDSKATMRPLGLIAPAASA